PHSTLRTHDHLPPTLFPYTTLFRSQAGTASARTAGRSATAREPGSRTTLATYFKSDRGLFPRAGEAFFRRAWARRPAGCTGISRDRKSTRLNSSHLGISYAVFCLKK